MWPEPVERVARELRAAAAEATIQEFPHGTPTAEAAAKAIGCSLDQIVKSIVFVAGRSYLVALVPGDRRADAASVAKAADVVEVRVATAKEVVDATGFEPGAVSPFPLPRVHEVLMERTLLQHPKVWFGAGTPAHMAALAPGELQRIADAKTADLVG
jgi:prolyl-tRNA editing enzyme YbaK/EbsC (Cys-tRNA(Pro) deacylase)